MTSLPSFRRPSGAAAVLALALLACGNNGSPPPPPAAAPVVSSVSPGIVPTAGNVPVVIQGSAFTSPARAFFGGVEATVVKVVSETQITATVPPHAAGTVDVKVQNPDGQQGTLPSALGYSDAPPPPPASGPPTLTGVDPTSGLDTGGTPVTLTGTNFDATTVVRFGGAEATVTARSATSLTAVTPVHADATVDVTVTNGDGTSATKPAAFAFVAPPATLPPPSLASVTPAAAPEGAHVVLAGTGFSSPTVTFGAVQAQVVSTAGTSITVIAPAGLRGTVSVTVTNGDAKASTLSNAFTYKPAVARVTPPTATVNTTPTITVTGTGFQGGATVAFGGTAATNVVVSPAGTSLTAAAPASANPANVQVVVTNPDGQASNGVTFSYVASGGLPAPAFDPVTPMVPTTAVLTGGLPFTINGSNFLAGATVTIGGKPVLDAVVANTGGSITGTIPAGAAAGPASVVVTNIDGQAATFNGFSYVNPPPRIQALNVMGAPVSGGTTLLIVGTGFSASPLPAVSFGGVPATSVAPDPVSANVLDVVVPPYTGSLDPTFQDAYVPIVLQNPDGQSDTFARFHYGPPPAISSVTPSGSASPLKAGNGDLITVTGTNFRVDVQGLQLSVGGVFIAPNTTPAPTRTQIVFTLPKNRVFQPPLSYPVLVTNFDGQFGVSTDRLFFQ
jgi:hypothetical protein